MIVFLLYKYGGESDTVKALPTDTGDNMAVVNKYINDAYSTIPQTKAYEDLKKKVNGENINLSIIDSTFKPTLDCVVEKVKGMSLDDVTNTTSGLSGRNVLQNCLKNTLTEENFNKTKEEVVKYCNGSDNEICLYVNGNSNITWNDVQNQV